ncbi:AraC family transcriptional regulator [Streptomyces sp. UNOB3_S3]|uniref:AraC family transcriptional regulator n=1 Tax=Streptomyces sp. UNOB3_S3 TaxID=2871682 RepID=UPI001E418AAE|nr:AraC family transcriptional regulator [Streptomyces sp. UNOB3_S3]MCC3776860.1 AraC family transcriptional regulator [Streptomyces sp. UNOB3_S3]
MAKGNGWVRYWRDGARPLEAMHAHFFDHVYSPHSHDAYSFGITDVGAQSFHCRGASHTSGAGMVMAFNPDEVHDGRAAAELGYQYRIVHIGPSVVSDTLADAADGSAGAMPLFVRPVLTDPVLTGALARLHEALVQQAGSLVREELLTTAVLALAERGATRAPRRRTLVGEAQRRAARQARSLINEAFLEPISAQELAAVAGCSRFALYRAFRSEFGMPPSDYQRLLRLRRARQLLTDGQAPADAAASAGFSDQAHFNRWFKRTYGITPAVYQRAGQ